jgi:hypothetical protein
MRWDRRKSEDRRPKTEVGSSVDVGFWILEFEIWELEFDKGALI